MLPSIPQCPIALPIATLSAWHDHELPEEQARQTQDHIQSCAACQRYLTALDQTGQAIRRHTPPVDVQAAVWRHVHAAMAPQRGAQMKTKRTLALTGIAAAVVIIALFAYAFASFANKPAIQPIATATPTVGASTLFTVLQAGASTSASSSSLVGYDASTGHVRFSNSLPGFAFDHIAATHNLVGVVSSTSASTALLVFDTTGRQVRQVSLGSFGVQFLLASSDTFYVGGEDTAGITKATSTVNAPHLQVMAFVASTGAQRWQQTVADATAMPETFDIAGEELLGAVSNQAGSSHIVALNAKTGAPDWTLPLASGATFAIGGDAVYVLSSARSSGQSAQAAQMVAAYAVATGAARWNHPIASTSSGATPVTPVQNTLLQLVAADQQGIYCAVTQVAANASIMSVTLTALAAGDGAQRWSVSEDQVLAPTPVAGQPSPVGNGQLYIATVQQSNGKLPTIKLAGVDLITGATHAVATLAGPPLLPPVVAGGSLYVAVQPLSSTGHLGSAAIAAFSAAGAPRWQVQTSSAYIRQLVTLP